MSQASVPVGHENDIAIIGMALRVPGARGVEELWQNLRDGVESIRTPSDEELIAAGESRERLAMPNYVRATAELPDMEGFDREFFGFSPKVAATMDPQHRHFLECAWEALEDGTRLPSSLEGPVGVFAGCGTSSYFYFHVLSHADLVASDGLFLLRHTGNDKDFLATRVSHAFDLRGPSLSVQSACSTSLVAVHYACQSLLSSECDMALAGAVTIELPHRRGYLYQEGEILSPDGHCHAFDHRAAGTVFGSGVGVVVLRRLADALADGDPIRAVIRATAVNNDGADKASYLAPSVRGQSSAAVEAMCLADVPPESIGYIECHGTGTQLGDPIELEALTQAYRRSTAARGFCRIGSVKTNIGHLDTAAGVVSLIKAALVVERGEIPPSLGYERPNPAFDLASSPFVVADTLQPFRPPSGPRRAAVNSLGVGGTNAHAILEEPPARAARRPRVEEREATPLLLSSRSPAALDAAAFALADHLEAHPELSLADVGFTLLTGRARFARTRAFAARDRQEAIDLLREPDSRRVHSHTAIDAPVSAVFLFPGGGAQHPAMARDLYTRDADFRADVDEGLGHLPAAAAQEIRARWLDSEPGDREATEALLRPSLQLPAILIVEVAIARAWMRRGVQPAALLGHSMGENAAACIAGVFSLADAVALVRLRGELFETVERGAMLSVGLSAEELRARLPSTLDIACVNGPCLCVVSGAREPLEAFRVTLAEEGVEARSVPIDIAAHSRHLEPILTPFEDFLRKRALTPPSIPIVSNRTGALLEDAEACDAAYWVRHLRETILFHACVTTLAADPKRVYIEVGPGKTLSGLVRAHGGVPSNQVIGSLRHADEALDDVTHLRTAFGRAYALGLDVDLEGLFDHGACRRVSLPTYRFVHQPYFLERIAPALAPSGDPLSRRPALSTWGHMPVWSRAAPLGTEEDRRPARSFLFFLDDAGIGARLVERLRADGHRVVTVSAGDTFAKLDADRYVLSPEHGRGGFDALLAALGADGASPEEIVHLWLLTADETHRPGSSFFHRNQERGFYSLFFLAQALSSQGGGGPLHLSVITNGMMRVGDERLPHPDKATALGPATVLPKELPATTCRVIDVAFGRREDNSRAWTELLASSLRGRRARDAEDAALVESLLEELSSTPASELVALRGGKRWLRTYRPLDLPSAETGAALLREGGLYLVTGGFGGLGSAMAEELARRAHARLALVSRRVLPPPEHYDDALADPETSPEVLEAIGTIRRLERLGAEVIPICADVSNLERMRELIEGLRRRYGRIAGVLHAAGTIHDELIELKSISAIADVFTAKIHGTYVLERLLLAHDDPPDFFVLFSSTSSDTAPRGQADYVAANAYLNAVAASRAGDARTKTLAIHWGVFRDAGIAARAVADDGSGAGGARLRPTSEPLFSRWVEDATRVPWLEAPLSTSDWLIDDHRLRSGEAILPGTGYLELAAEALRECGQAGPFELEELLFLRPLHVPDTERREARVRLERVKGGYELTIKSEQLSGATRGYQRHAQARIRPLEVGPPPRLDLRAIDARCTRQRASSASLASAQESFLRFGPRWRVLRSIALGDGEALAQLELPEAFAEDLTRLTLHPALLDLATGFALELVEGYDPSGGLYVPVSYGRARVHAPLPRRLASWARLVTPTSEGADFVTFDVTVTDADGEVLLEVERFTMKRVGTLCLDLDPQELEPVGLHASTGVGRSSASARLAAQVEQGIRPAEGAELLLRALALEGVPEPILTAVDLEALRAEAAPATKSVFSHEERPELDSAYVAPADHIERTLAGLWEELLGVRRVGTRDNFFDLGGHSLIAVRLFATIRRTFDVDLPISVLFEAPTIADCAALIRGASGAPTARASGTQRETPQPRYTHLVAMHPSEGRPRVPFFLCAGMFGNVLNLRHLAHLIGSDRPFYGLQARGLYGEQAPHESFADMARAYLEEVRIVQPHGPYLLGGFSGGGITAYEMAQQLSAAGEEVALLVMLDTPLPSQPALTINDRLELKLQRLRRQGPRYVRTWVEERFDWESKQLRARLQRGGPVPSERFHNEAIEAAFRRALRAYVVEPYDGPLRLLRPRLDVMAELSGGRLLSHERRFLYEDNGWAAYARDLGVFEVPGDHDTMVLEPNVRVVAEKLREWIDRAERQRLTLRIAGGEP